MRGARTAPLISRLAVARVVPPVRVAASQEHDYGPLLVGHGVLMAISWMLLAPLGAIVSRYLRASLRTSWLLVHRSLMLLAVTLTVIGLIFAVMMVRQHALA